MIEPIRNGILGVNGAADDIDEDFLNDDKTENEVSTFVPFTKNRMLSVKDRIYKDCFGTRFIIFKLLESNSFCN